MKDYINKFPINVRADIAKTSTNGGVLSSQACARICELMSLDRKSLMIQLLPFAANFSNAPISSYRVGAVASGIVQPDGSANLYFGANFEFENQALCHSIHAEQSAVSNAWLHDEPGIIEIATSSAPCGHCRQFLYEFSSRSELEVLMPHSNIPPANSLDGESNDCTGSEKSAGNSSTQTNYDSINLSLLLPHAFGPLDMGCEENLMGRPIDSNGLKLVHGNGDELVQQAFQAANQSYAPYTKNFTGCAIQIRSGDIFQGRYVENAAHNPSLPAFSAAISNMNMSSQNIKSENIERVVMVENSTSAGQKDSAQTLLKAYNGHVTMEYHRAINASL